jgi:hypothetical protein
MHNAGVAGRFGRAACAAILLAVALPSAYAQNAPPAAVTASIQIPRETVYEHECFDMVLAIEIRDTQVGRSIELAGMPDTKVLQFGQFAECPIQRFNRAGRQVEIRSYKCEVRALMPGTVPMSPSLRLAIVRAQSGSFGSMRFETPFTLSVAPVTIRVSPLPPPPRDAVFSGAVGQFSFSAHASPTNLAAGDLVKVVSRIAGRGWTDNVVAPRLSPGGAFRVYEPRPLPSQPGETPELRFEQTLVPQTTNATEVPALGFTYFDPAAGTYRTSTAGPFRLQFQARRTVIGEEAFAPPNRNGAATDAAPRALPATMAPATRWTLLAAATVYWLAVVFAMAGMASRARRGVAGALALLVAAVILFVGATTWARQRFLIRPAGFAVRQEDARVSPGNEAFVSFTVPKDASVTRIEELGDWVKVECAGNRGWIPAKALKPAE